MRFKVELNETEIKNIIIDYINDKLGTAKVENVHILVKSKQNYRSTWEDAGLLITSTPEDKIPELKIEVEAG